MFLTEINYIEGLVRTTITAVGVYGEIVIMAVFINTLLCTLMVTLSPGGGKCFTLH